MDQSVDRNLLDNVILPVATEKDARVTAEQLAIYNPTRVTALHVIEKGQGVPDKTPVEQSKETAERSFAAVREEFPDADEHTMYARDVVGAIFEAAKEVDASAIAYRSRSKNRIVQFLSGDLSLKLITKADCPVIALPQVETEKSEQIR